VRSFARCVRAHVTPDFPDPLIGSDGVPRFPDSAPRVPATSQQACRRFAAEIPARYSSTTAVSSVDYARLLRLAHCIRAHGIPHWPDPNALGEFRIDPTKGGAGKRAFAAVRACARMNTDTNGGVDVVRAQQAP